MPKAKPILLDTCAAIWLAEGTAMAPASLAAIETARRTGAGVYVSSMTAWEFATLAARGKIAVAGAPLAWFEELMSQPGLRVAELTAEILVASTALPDRPGKDPVDRILIATARALGASLVTRDQDILAYGARGHVAALAC